MKNKEILTANFMFDEMERRKRELTELISEKEQALVSYPKGDIHAITKGNHFEYYLRMESSDKSGKYIKKKEQGLIRALSQKKYDQRVLYFARQELENLNTALQCLNDCGQIQKQYRKLSPGIQAYVKPDYIEDEDFVQRWENQQFNCKSTANLKSDYYTDKDEQVRSKSEINIANLLKKNGIPYRYEAELPFANPFNFHPDFTILKVKSRETIYWEHLGMMDKNSYAIDSVARLKYYQRYGIIPGKNLILSMETADNQLGIKEIQRLIDELILK